MAARYWVGGNSTWDATAGTKWSLTSGGAGGQAVPTSADDVFFDGASGTVTVTVAATANALSLNFTGFTGTFAGVNTLNIFGNLTLAATATYTYTGALGVNASGTYTSNGATWLGALTIAVTGNTITLADAFILTNTFTVALGSGTIVLNGSTFTCKGNFSVSAGRTVSGTSTIIFGGTIGTSTISGGTISNNVIFNSTNAISFGSWVQAGGSLTYTAASSFVHTGTLTITGSCTLNTAGITLFNITCVTNGLTITINSLLSVTTISLAATIITFAGTSGFTCGTISSLVGDIVFQSSNTYTFTTSVSIAGTAANPALFTASASPTKAIVTFSPGCSMDIGFCSPTDIDSSLGRTVLTYKGTITNCNNWRILPVVPATITN